MFGLILYLYFRKQALKLTTGSLSFKCAVELETRFIYLFPEGRNRNWGGGLLLWNWNIASYHCS